MKLLQAVKSDDTDEEFILKICDAVDEKMEELERGKCIDAKFFERERYSKWSDIFHLSNEIRQEYDDYDGCEWNTELEDKIGEMKDMILDYQVYFKGIGKVEI